MQLARNGASHVHAVDIQPAAVANTLTNAFRNGVADRVSATALDLYPWVPEERYDVIVASLDQEPADPVTQDTSHRQVDFWGRNLLDHLIGLLPEALDDDGVAYVVQLSDRGRAADRPAARAPRLRRCASSTTPSCRPRACSTRAATRSATSRSTPTPTASTVGDQDLVVAYLLEVATAR